MLFQARMKGKMRPGWTGATLTTDAPSAPHIRARRVGACRRFQRRCRRAAGDGDQRLRPHPGALASGQPRDPRPGGRSRYGGGDLPPPRRNELRLRRRTAAHPLRPATDALQPRRNSGRRDGLQRRSGELPRQRRGGDCAADGARGHAHHLAHVARLQERVRGDEPGAGRSDDRPSAAGARRLGRLCPGARRLVPDRQPAPDAGRWHRHRHAAPSCAGRAARAGSARDTPDGAAGAALPGSPR